MTTSKITKQRGVTLIELMVALTIGLFLTMAVTSIIVITLRQQRMSGSVNVRDQAAAQAMAQLDKVTRSAGSSLSNAWDLGLFGCQLRASKDGTKLLPAASLPAPFDNTTDLASPVVAPLLIDKGVGANDSDVLYVLGGKATGGDVPRYLRGISTQTLALDNVIGFKANDLVIVAAQGFNDCYVSQVQTVGSAAGGAVADTMDLGGKYYAESVAGAVHTLTEVVSSKAAYAAPIGNTAAAQPTLQLIGVGAGDALQQLDLLQTRSSGAQTMADGVSHLFAAYGIDTDLNGKIDAWVDPGSTEWSVTAVKASSKKIRQIVAVRIALVTHSREGNQANVSPSEITVFEDWDSSLQRKITLTNAQRAQRYKVTDTIIPLRNNLLIEP